MDKTYRNEFRRLFLLEHLPEPLTRSDAHLQIFDNYIENTRLRQRSVRVPETKEWNWIFQQRFATDEDSACWKIAEIHLNETEYHLFEQFEGREIRKNRYFYESDGRRIEIDVFLGNLWGLNLARVCFETLEELFEGENVELLKRRARKMGTFLLISIYENRTRNQSAFSAQTSM